MNGARAKSRRHFRNMAGLAFVSGIVLSVAACDGTSEDTFQSAALTATIPIKHVVVIVKENHTFDNYFGAFPGAEGTLNAAGQNLCPTATGGLAPCAGAPDAPGHDLCHSHDCSLADWNGGQMNGWNSAGGSDTGDGLAYAQYGEADIPNYWQYARHFVLGDHFFANVHGPSLPGHMFTVAAQAGWAIGNPPNDLPFKVVFSWPPKFLGPHPYWGCDEWPGDTVPILAGGTTPKSVSPASGFRLSPTFCQPAPTGSSTAPTSTGCSARSGLRWTRSAASATIQPAGPTSYSPTSSRATFRITRCRR